jgi:hypothetical protein
MKSRQGCPRGSRLARLVRGLDDGVCVLSTHDPAVAVHDPRWGRSGLADSEMGGPKSIHFAESKLG